MRWICWLKAVLTLPCVHMAKCKDYAYFTMLELGRKAIMPSIHCPACSVHSEKWHSVTLLLQLSGKLLETTHNCPFHSGMNLGAETPRKRAPA